MRMREPSRIWRAVTLSVELFIILSLLISAVLLAYFPRTAMKFLGFNAYTISYTGSMEPDLKFNDLIIVRRYNFNSVNEGDIITFEVLDKDGNIVHITHKVEQKFLASDGTPLARTKGTNIKHADIVPVSEHGIDGTNRYVGKLAFKSTIIGNLLAFIKSPPGALTVAVDILCIMGIAYILKPKPFESQLF